MTRHVSVLLASMSADVAHATLADEGGDVVMGEAGADFKRHGLSG